MCSDRADTAHAIVSMGPSRIWQCPNETIYNCNGTAPLCLYRAVSMLFRVLWCTRGFTTSDTACLLIGVLFVCCVVLSLAVLTAVTRSFVGSLFTVSSPCGLADCTCICILCVFGMSINLHETLHLSNLISIHRLNSPPIIAHKKQQVPPRGSRIHKVYKYMYREPGRMGC